ncbi:MAG: 4-hydroxythreonine-4-phosphate dehydrogenase PdxA [Erysipelotrichaceae bacterium]|nr:4-hydroxythreonine-4-phosphate dehydrogenase PdxA [Erysipelotrichaceae bacterium]
MKKRLGITMGDPAGIGPEIILKIMDVYMNDVVIYGSYDVLDHYNKKNGFGYLLNRINDPDETSEDRINIIDPNMLNYTDFTVGNLSAACGKSAYFYLENAVEDALRLKIRAIVTCPLNKEALHMGGYNYAGHTEILAELTHASGCAMLLWSDRLKAIHVSTHVSLAEAIQRVKKDRIVEVSLMANDILSKAGYDTPKIAVAGLNPHAGENGLFGDEEIKEIIPAVSELREKGLNVSGPIPPDTVFLKCLNGEYDLVVAMYHDQGHIPLKLLDFDGGVNITCGLPIIRTSVDHGTAFDIAGKNIARPDSLIKAIEAADMISGIRDIE